MRLSESTHMTIKCTVLFFLLINSCFTVFRLHGNSLLQSWRARTLSLTTGLTARILRSLSQDPTSISKPEPKPCFKLLQAEATRVKDDSSTRLNVDLGPSAHKDTGGCKQNTRSDLPLTDRQAGRNLGGQFRQCRASAWREVALGPRPKLKELQWRLGPMRTRQLWFCCLLNFPERRTSSAQVTEKEGGTKTAVFPQWGLTEPQPL